MRSDKQKDIRPFTFERSFDFLMTPEEELAIQKKREEEEEAPPSYSEEELASAREEAYQDGLQAGLKEALTGIEQQVSATLDVLVATIGRIGEQQTLANELISRETVELAVAAVRKLFPTFAEQGGKEEVEKFVFNIISRLLDEPYLNIHVSETLRPEIERHLNDLSQRIGFNGKISVSPDNSLGPADCRVQWSDGEAEKLTESILKEIEALVVSLPRVKTPSMEISAEASQVSTNHKDADADSTPITKLETAEKPIPAMETESPISSSESMTDQMKHDDSTETPADLLTSENPSTDVTPPKFSANSIVESEVTDEDQTAPEPA
ncbi:MAG: hypothetical protein CMP14_08200 [Rickettsiales bacterium]|nr:hypothetical protein [Rickettsiales bacterium]|tara:strand:- start:111 stop:1082 length:972 start_codon:yes stop_codon:yes gene_type:complete